jgi:predicted nuclease of restriction endonuclease-like (RecB) superfamily
LYKRQGKAITNFSSTLALPEQQLAQEILKDPLDLNFLHLKKGYDEHVLEEALVTNITNFLLELGKGFSYVGRHKTLHKPAFPTMSRYSPTRFSPVSYLCMRKNT